MDNSMVTLMGYTFNIFGVIIGALFILLIFAFRRAQKSGRLDWTDMITREGNKVSATKVLQLVGGIVGTWIMIQMTLNNSLNWDLFAIYLGYVASIDGFSKLVLAKYGASSNGLGVSSSGLGTYEDRPAVPPPQDDRPTTPPQ